MQTLFALALMGIGIGIGIGIAATRRPVRSLPLFSHLQLSGKLLSGYGLPAPLHT
jgi:hypothetical protein